MRRFSYPLIAVLILLADRLLKHYVLTGSEWSFGVLKITLFRNHGLLFSLPFPYWASVSVMIVAIVLLGGFIWFRRHDPNLRWAIMFLLVGAVSNLYDRIILGSIIDYFYFSRWWPIFNLADIAILTALILGMRQSRARAGVDKPIV